MTKKELLTTYRTRVIELEDLKHQIARVGSDGRPSGAKTMQYDQIGGGTNMPGAAAMHLADGLEALAARKEKELHQLGMQVGELLLAIDDMRTYLVIQHYYVFAQTDEQIADLLAITRQRANQIRLDYVDG